MLDLREIRKSRGYTLKMIADEANTTPVTIWRYEKGKRKPSVRMAKRLALIYGIPWTDFFKDVA